MSYQIEYPVENHLQKSYALRGRKKIAISSVLVLCFVALAVMVYAIGIDTLKEILVPGDNQITISAFENMQENLGNGMPAGDAIVAFCSEILQSANAQ